MIEKTGLDKIRNIGVIAHIDAGKTTTTERMLLYTKKIHKIGEVHDGTATMDWMVQEQERGITITSASTTCFWNDIHINIIDTPGHVDFTVEVERSLKVLDGAVVVFCAVAGVQPQSETVWRQADKYSVPRVAFANKMDRVGADFNNVLAEMHQKLGANAAAIQIPVGAEENFIGIIDILEEELVTFEGEKGEQVVRKPCPEEYKAQVAKVRHDLVEKVAEADDNIMELYIHNKPVSKEELKKAIRATVIANKFVPVLCGTSLKNKGIQLVLDAACDYLPSPIDLPAVKGFEPETGEYEERAISPDAPFCAFCFKIMSDPYVGRLNFVRIYSGKIKAGETIYNSSKREDERLSKIVRMHANKQEMIEEASAGDIVAFVGLKETKTGDTLCKEDQPIVLEAIKFPEPVVDLAIETKSKADQEKLAFALRKLQDEDPSFRVTYNTETAQTIISGMGQLHLEIAVDRILREFNVEAKVGRPQVAYRESIRNKVNITGKFIQQSGGRGQYGHVVLVMEPQEVPGAGITFEDTLKGGVIPREFIPAVKNGIILAAKSGIMGSYPVTDVAVTLVDGSYHDVDSSEIAFQMAASIAFQDGLRKGVSFLLEPIMDIEIVVPEEFMGTVIGDFNSRRGKLVSMGQRGNVRVLRGHVPLAEVFDYANIIRSLTQGRASFTMEPFCYQEVPRDIANKILGLK
ncbi:MAG TPA: elongation factor G [Candidatus Omnitrophica bacterium]|nr:elongation factor G [Candidatus Omnitrophota bacterium]